MGSEAKPFGPPVSGVERAATWLPADGIEEFELLEELLESGVQPIMKRKTAATKNAAGL